MPVDSVKILMVIPETERQIGKALSDFLMIHSRHAQALVTEFGLSILQAGTLWHIDPEVPLPMNALADKMSYDPANVTGIIDKLEARGLVQRRAVEGDRRVKMLVLTAAGVALRAEFIERVAVNHPVIGRLAPEDKQLLLDILQRGLQAFRDAGA